MTDEAYTFRQTEMERKRLGRGAFARKCGSRSKKCSLPSDKLTEKQRKELNSEVYTYDMNKPMDWSTFTAMPKDLQGLYLEKLCKVYRGRRIDAAKMFGITPGGLGNYITRTFGEFHPFESLNGQKGISIEWLRWTKPESFDEPKVKEPQPEEKEQVSPTSCVKQTLDPVAFALDSGELKFTGNLRGILSKMLVILDPSGNYELTIGFEKKTNDVA